MTFLERIKQNLSQWRRVGPMDAIRVDGKALEELVCAYEKDTAILRSMHAREHTKSTHVLQRLELCVAEIYHTHKKDIPMAHNVIMRVLLEFEEKEEELKRRERRH